VHVGEEHQHGQGGTRSSNEQREFNEIEDKENYWLGGVWFACWWNHRTRAVRNTNKGEGISTCGAGYLFRKMYQKVQQG